MPKWGSKRGKSLIHLQEIIGNLGLKGALHRNNLGSRKAENADR